MTSDQLKKVAELLREKAAALEADAMVRCGQAIQAAQALNVLREKVGSHVR